MTPLEYMQKKNEILLELTGETLIPASQLKDVEPVYMPLAELLKRNETDSKICPYCLVYLIPFKYVEELEECAGCPMNEADNNCISQDEGDSTYRIVINALEERTSYSNFCNVPEIIALVAEYNEQFNTKKETE